MNTEFIVEPPFHTRTGGSLSSLRSGSPSNMRGENMGQIMNWGNFLKYRKSFSFIDNANLIRFIINDNKAGRRYMINRYSSGIKGSIFVSLGSPER